MRAAVVLVLLAALTGCTEVRETLVLDSKGGGTYALTVRWNADLWRRVGEHIPAEGRQRLEGHPFPLTAADWRGGLDGLEGVTVVSLEERDAGDGWRELAVELSFRSLADLFRWEVLARRGAKLTVERKGEGDSGVRIARLVMEPLVFVPVLDPLDALLDAIENPPAKAEGLRAHRDPPPLRRFGLDRAPAEDLWQFAGPQVAKAKFAFDVTVSGRLEEVGGKPTSGRTDTARFAFDFAALRDPDTDRGLSLAWRVPDVDADPPTLDHAGETRDAIVAGLER